MEKIDPDIIEGTLAAICSNKCENNHTDGEIPMFCDLAKRVGRDHCIPWYLDRIKELQKELNDQEKEYQKQLYSESNLAAHKIESAEMGYNKLKDIIDDCLDCSIKLDEQNKRPRDPFKILTEEELKELEPLTKEQIMEAFREGAKEAEVAREYFEGQAPMDSNLRFKG